MAQVKRKKYEAHFYATELAELTNLMNQVPKLQADREAWDIEGNWGDTGTIYFVDAIYQAYFTRFIDFDCRSIKIVNYGRPAVRLSFFKEHKFWVIKNKDLPRDEKIARIQLYLNELGHKMDRQYGKLAKLKGSELTKAKANMALWQSEQTIWNEMMANVDLIEMAISNYERVHKYVTLNYKFILNEEGDFANAQEHMLNPQKDRAGTINQHRFNIIFVDTEHIRRAHPYQSKQIDKYLAGFGQKSQAGLYTLYARLRPEGDSIASFEVTVPTTNSEQMERPITLGLGFNQSEANYPSPSSRKRQKPKPAPLFDELQNYEK